MSLAFDKILNELRSMKTEFITEVTTLKIESQQSQKLIKSLTEEVIALRSEVRQLKSLPSVDAELKLLPTLPFVSLPRFQEFDDKLLLDDEMKLQFVGQTKHIFV